MILMVIIIITITIMKDSVSFWFDSESLAKRKRLKNGTLFIWTRQNSANVGQFSSVQFSSRWYLCAREGPYALWGISGIFCLRQSDKQTGVFITSFIF